MSYVNPNFEKHFGVKATHVFSAPGRTELSGNHTDHQHGQVLAAAVNLEMLAWVKPNNTTMIRVMSEGYSVISEIDVTDLEIKENEKNTTNALIRGVVAKFIQMGCEVKGFDAYVTSTVLPGSGLSSSAAYETLIGTIINHLYYGAKATAVEVAQIGQWAENVYFGKPCGLMDQTASSVGSVIGIDFADNANPIVEKIDLDLTANGYALCIIDSGADHADAVIGNVCGRDAGIRNHFPFLRNSGVSGSSVRRNCLSNCSGTGTFDCPGIPNQGSGHRYASADGSAG